MDSEIRRPVTAIVAGGDASPDNLVMQSDLNIDGRGRRSDFAELMEEAA